MTGLTQDDLQRMRDQLFFEGPDMTRRLSRYWLLLPLSAVIAAAGVVSDSTATVIGAMIVAPLMTPILGVVLSVVLRDGPNLRRCLVLLVAGAAAVVGLAWILGLFVPYPVVAATSSQVASRISPRLVDLVAALATGAVGSVALARSDISDTLPRGGHRHLLGAPPGSGGANPGIRDAPPGVGLISALRHQRDRHPGQWHRGDGLLPGPSDLQPARRLRSSGPPSPAWWSASFSWPSSSRCGSTRNTSTEAVSG